MAMEAIESSFGILRWPYLAAPRPSETGGEPRFAATFVAGGPNGLRPGDTEFGSAIYKQMDEAAVNKWGAGIEQMRQRCMQQNRLFNVALKRNNDPSRAKHAGIGSAPAGFHFECKTKFPPDFFDPTGAKLAAADPMMFYDGAVVRVWVSAYCFEHPKSGPGVGLNLHGVQFVAHGPRLGGVDINAGAVDPRSLPSDLPQAPAPVAPGPATGFGGPGQPPAASPEASHYGGGGFGGFGSQPQGQPQGQPYGQPQNGFGGQPQSQPQSQPQGQPQGQPPSGFGF